MTDSYCQLPPEEKEEFSKLKGSEEIQSIYMKY
jgi:hypothetical protein